MKKFKAWLLKTFFKAEIESAHDYLECVCEQIKKDNEQDERDIGVMYGVDFMFKTFGIEIRR